MKRKNYPIYVDFASMMQERELAFEYYTQILADYSKLLLENENLEKENNRLKKENEVLSKPVVTTKTK